MIGPMGLIETSNHLLDRLLKHQGKCGSLEEIDGQIRCTKCGIAVKKDEVPKLEGKGFVIEYY
jgi:hypothetical protein